MQKAAVVISFLLLFSMAAFAQEGLADSAKVMEETVVTATRTDRKLGNAAVPVSVISRKEIEASGSLRLHEVLQQQTGMVVTSGSGSGAVGGGIFGNGVQLQGLSADYTLVLIDGEPVIGRQGGVLDLSRLALGNIRKIEIVKGPSSSLYGSEAMGGVINLITEEPRRNSLKAGVRYGSFNLLDVNLQGNYKYKNTQLSGYFSRNSSRGYDLDPATPEKTVDPYYHYTGQLNVKQRFSDKTFLLLNTRYDFGHHDSYYAIGSKDINIDGYSSSYNLSVNPTLKHYFSDKVKATLRLQGSFYDFRQNLDSIVSGNSYYSDYFKQNFLRAENQTDIRLSDKNQLIAGGGYIYQTVATNRYNSQKEQHLYYGFVQDEWDVSDKWQLIGGLRYDHSSAYAGHLSPKLAVLFKASPRWSFNASYGSGFKAPDFRQLYLDFINNAALGYAIYGANEFSLEKLQQQMNAGIIGAILPEAYAIKELKPETSDGFNLGAKYFDQKKFSGELNLFYNRINQLINYIPVALNANGTQVFSYVNVARALTAGGELNLNYQISPSLKATAGYQYLYTADLDVLDRIKAGKVYGRRSENGGAVKMGVGDYTGLLNRSPHMLSARLTYDDAESGIMGSLFAGYRSRWGVTDLDGNGFANMDKEFAGPYLQLNLTGGYKISEVWKVQAGINNILNYTDALNLPSFPGRNFFVGIQYSRQ